MALVLADRVQETTASTGTGSVTLAGAVLGYQSFAVVGNGNTTFYVIADQGGPNWEVGIGTYTASGTTLSRDTVLASSNAGALVSFTAGTKTVFISYPAEKSVNLNAAGNVSPLGTIASGTWNGTVIGPTYGGTGQSTYTAGDILYSNGTNTLTKLAIGSTGYLLSVVGGVPSWIPNTSTTNNEAYFLSFMMG